jgi:predicted aldo/keto reductase-like oxidoreductase
MEYSLYGKTGLRISRLGFGGMRFAEPKNVSKMAEIVLAAYDEGINYFDTAPTYCADMSEKIIGRALRQMRSNDSEFYLSSKTSKPDAEGVRADLHRSLERFGVDRIDFYHCWYILTLDGWERRKAGGAVDALLAARQEGLVRHLAFSTHLAGHEVKKVIDENIFEGVTLGYNAVNFPYREEGVRAASRAGMGLVVMNPLGGGIIPDNPETFSYIINRSGQSIVSAALEFLWSHSEITTALVGFRNIDDLRSAVGAWKNFGSAMKIEIEKMKQHVEDSFDRLCTGCQYCKDCPQGIEVYKYIEAYNHLMLKSEESLQDRLKWHYGIENLHELDLCTACGECEKACTQQLPILERLDEIKRIYGNPS